MPLSHLAALRSLGPCYLVRLAVDGLPMNDARLDLVILTWNLRLECVKALVYKLS